MEQNTVAPIAQPTTDVERVIDVINEGFVDVPMSNTFIVEIDSTPPPYPSSSIDLARRRRHFENGLRSIMEDGGTAVQAGDWSAIALWEPPGFKGRAFTDLGAGGPLRTEWRSRVAAAKAKHLGDRTFWHLAFLVRNPHVHVPGAISAVVRPFMEQAKTEGVPVWLEAVDERGVAIYKHWGFQLVETVLLGEGTHNEMGWPEPGGKGIYGYCMMCPP